MITIMETVDRVVNGPVVLDKPNQIKAFHYLAQFGACKLELRSGLKHSSGRSVIQHVKQEHGWMGNKLRVVCQFRDWLVQQGYLQNQSKFWEI